MQNKKNIIISWTGSFLPGTPVPFDEIDKYLGVIDNAPRKVQKWLGRINLLMKEMLDIDYYHYAIDPETGKFTEDNVTMSIKAAKTALETVS